jgi:hypothetical protein
MTSQHLYGILKMVDSLDQTLGLQKKLEAIKEALISLVGSPAQPTYQSNLAIALKAFTGSADLMAESISPSEATAIQEMGGAEFFDPAIASKVVNSVQTNAMTPSVAREFVEDLSDRRSAFLTTVRNACKSLEKLGISDYGLKSGMADVAFLIPRDIFDNKLGLFAKELSFISRLVQDFTEARTGRPEPVTLEQLSSSIPTVTLIAALPALQMLGVVINKYLEAWERIEKIRQMRAQLADMGLKGKSALQELTDEITTTVTKVVEESTELVMADYKGDRGELANAIRSDTRRLFGQIERGLTVEFRANFEETDGESQVALQQIASIGKELKFPQVAIEPLLLKSGEVLEDVEGDGTKVIRHTKKTTTEKTTTSKKAPSDDRNQE